MTHLPIINRSEFNFLPQFDFTKISGQRWENLEFRVPVPMIDLANELKDDFFHVLRYVYQESPQYNLKNIFIKPQIITGEEAPIENDVEFQRIQETLIQGIRDAKYLIWVAVAWFTNDTLFHELLQRSKSDSDVKTPTV